MKIEKIFNIRVFDGKKAIRERILAFSRAVIAKAELKTLLEYDARTFAANLDKSTIILLMLETEICAMVRCHVSPLRDQSQNLHPKDIVWISDFAVLPKYRGIGLADMLLGVISNYSRYLGKRKLRISLPPVSSSLLLFLKYKGFQPSPFAVPAAHSFLELDLKITTGKTCQQIPSPPEPDLEQFQK